MIRKTSIVFACVIAGLPQIAQAQAPATPPTVRLCTGARDGNYEFSGIQIAQQARGR